MPSRLLVSLKLTLLTISITLLAHTARKVGDETTSFADTGNIDGVAVTEARNARLSALWKAGDIGVDGRGQSEDDS